MTMPRQTKLYRLEKAYGAAVRQRRWFDAADAAAAIAEHHDDLGDVDRAAAWRENAEDCRARMAAALTEPGAIEAGATWESPRG